MLVNHAQPSEALSRSASVAAPVADQVDSPTTRFLEVDRGRIAFDVRGDGPTVLMLPGLGDLRGSYRFLAPLVAELGYTVVTADLRGHGQSSARWPDYTTAACASDALALIQHVSDGPAFVVGNSFSAGVAVWAATERPGLVSGLALIGPFVRPQRPNPGMAIALRVMLGGPWRVRAWAAYHASLFKAARPADLQAHSHALRANLAEDGRFAALAAMIARSDAAVAERLQQVKAPAVVVMGSADPDFPDPAAEAREVAAALGGAAVMIPGAGHYPQAETPGATLDALRETMERATRGQA